MTVTNLCQAVGGQTRRLVLISGPLQLQRDCPHAAPEPLTTERHAPLAAFNFFFCCPPNRKQIKFRAFLHKPYPEDNFTPPLQITPSKTEPGGPDNTLFPSPLQLAPYEPLIDPPIAQDEPYQVH